MISEKICQAITTLSPLEIPNKIEIKSHKREYVLTISDQHFGTEFSIKDIFGNIINEYSPEIFEQRMWMLFSQLLDTIEKENINILHIMDLGDELDGVLRVSQLCKLRYGVIDSAIKYAEFMATWLNELSKRVIIKYHHTYGNHCELRMLNQPKGTFENENISKVTDEIIKIRLKDNPNFKFIGNPTGMIYAQICGYPVLGIHGEVRNMEKALKDFSTVYNMPISYLFAGHLHHSKTEEIGQDCEVINIPSIIGVDGYSLSLNKTSNAGARLYVFENFNGIVQEYRYKLN